MPKPDRASLQACYRTAKRARVGDLEALWEALSRGEPGALAQARAIGHALRGSGATFGFPEVTDAGALLEDAAQESAPRVVEGVIQLLRGIAWPDSPEGGASHPWLPAAVGLPPWTRPASRRPGS